MLYLVLKYLHVVGATVLGSGAGIAFFMLRAHLTGGALVISAVSRIVVLADLLFTASAVVAQPLTGIALVHVAGYSLTESWIVSSLVLYVVTGAFWLPVVWIQMQLRDLASAAARNNKPLPPRYYTLFRIWFAFGFPAFGAVMAILWLMIARPSLW